MQSFKSTCSCPHAVRVWLTLCTDIMSYMGDRKSSKPGFAHAIKLLANAMGHPADFRDEVYLQLVKQTSDNPKTSVHCAKSPLSSTPMLQHKHHQRMGAVQLLSRHLPSKVGRDH